MYRRRRDGVDLLTVPLHINFATRIDSCLKEKLYNINRSILNYLTYK